jgi:uncharacterized protein YbaA (DUF1428 family)
MRGPNAAPPLRQANIARLPRERHVGYVDGFVLPVPKKNIAAYRKMAKKASKIWMDHGALEYRECVGDDLNVKMGVPFTKQVDLQRGDTVVFAWIVYKSRAHRDRVNAKVMKDPRITSMTETEMPFDCKRMTYGGFKILVEA